MLLGSKWNRRSFLGSLGVIAGSVLAPRKLFASKSATGISDFGKSGNPYDELGVTTVINCQGTMTMLGGSVIRPELEAVMAQAGRHLRFRTVFTRFSPPRTVNSATRPM